MYSKTIFVAAFAAIASVASAATPPSCLLGAVNSYDKPADLKAICESKDATSKISKICGDAKADALEAFADICNGQGVKVCTSRFYLPTYTPPPVPPTTRRERDSIFVLRDSRTVLLT